MDRLSPESAIAIDKPLRLRYLGFELSPLGLAANLALLRGLMATGQ
jgi:hypothetical protein